MSEHGGNTNGCGCPIGNCDCDPVPTKPRLEIRDPKNPGYAVGDIVARDLSGILIAPGDYIVYAALWDRSAVLKYGLVTRLGLSKPRYSYKLKKHDVQEPTVRVVTVDRDFEHKWELQKKGNEVALGFVDRLLVISDDCVPEDARKLLITAYQQRQMAAWSKR